MLTWSGLRSGASKAIGLLLIGISLAGCQSSAKEKASYNARLPCSLQGRNLLLAHELPGKMRLYLPPYETPWPGVPDSVPSPIPGQSETEYDPYAGFVGLVESYFLWSGLYKGVARRMVDPRWKTDGETANFPHGVEFPNGGHLYATYPLQLFQVYDEIMDFGSVAHAQAWMTAQRIMNGPNSNPNARNGVETDPTLPRLGDDRYAYQLFAAPQGKVSTEIQVREQQLIYLVDLDSGPRYNAVTNATLFVETLMHREQSACS